MADLWASQSELVTKFLKELKLSGDSHTALSHVLHKNVKALETACLGLQEKLQEAQSENGSLQQRVQELEEQMQAAQLQSSGTPA